MNLSFAGKVALVTGAGGGIGLATAEAFAVAGAGVTLADINGDSIRAAAERIFAGRKVLPIRCNVADRSEVAAAMVETTVSVFGRLDAAFNNAGINSNSAPLLDKHDDEF